MKPGDIVVHKTTGQYAVVLFVNENTSKVHVRMAQEHKDLGTDYVERSFIPEELESVHDHLTRELTEMELRQEMLEAAKERAEQKKLAKMPAPKTATDIKVN